MIVSCPSCDSKYQVADEKVAGSMLRTRCKACGAQIVVDGTNPPPAGNPGDNDVTLRTHDEEQARLSAAPAPGKSKPPPPHRSSTPMGIGSVKPPPPARTRTQTGSHPIHSDKPDAAPKRPVVAINPADALDPNASSSDFYAKLLSKVGASQPVPAEAAADRGTGTARSDAPHSGLSSSLNSDAPTGDLYAKILAKVKPQKSEPPAPQADRHTSEHKTLPPTSWGSQPQEHQPGTHAASAAQPVSSQGVASAPIRIVQPATPEPFSPTKTAHGLGEIDIPVDFGGDADPNAATNQEARQKPEAALGARLTPVPPKRSEPPPSIQLPPINPSAESRPPSAGVATHVAPAQAVGSAPPAQNSTPVSKPEATLEPSIKSAAPAGDGLQPGFDPYAARPQKRMAGMIATVLGVGLLGVGGGVAATIYALKPSLSATRANAQTVVTSAPVAAAAAAPAQPQPSIAAVASASPAQSQAAEPNDSPKHSAEPSEKAAEKSVSAKSARTGAANVQAAAAPAVAAESRKGDPNVASGLDAKSAAKTNTKTGLPPAPSQSPSKGGGSGPFPKEVAMAMLGVAASQAPACKKPGGPTGTGKAIVTFDTDGQVVITNIVGEGFPGTPTAQCLAGLFRRVRVPPFGGDRATAAKIFVIPP